MIHPYPGDIDFPITVTTLFPLMEVVSSSFPHPLSLSLEFNLELFFVHVATRASLCIQDTVRVRSINLNFVDNNVNSDITDARPNRIPT